MCRAGGRRCPSHSDPKRIAVRNTKRREQYAQTHHSNPITSSLTEAQTAYFANSKAMIDGELVTVYHGSRHEFSSFDPATLGKGNDSWGNGFYFTDQENTAKGYAFETKSDTANVKAFYVNLTNPLYVDGKEKMSLNDVTFSPKQVADILKKHPSAYLQPNENDDDMSFLSDYAPEYWDKDEHTPAELNKMIDNVAKNYFSYGGWTELESLYGREHGSAFLEAIHEVTGHDGVIVDFGEHGKHYIAWFANQMKLTSNTDPEDNHNF